MLKHMTKNSVLKNINKGMGIMKRKVINRTGEENINSFGSKMIIAEYRKATDIDVYFP